MSARFVTPGEIIEDTEGFDPGEGTMSENGRIIALVGGGLVVDENLAEVRVESASTLPQPKVGDHLIGSVEKISEKAVMLRVLQIEGNRRRLPNDDFADMYVAKVVDRYLPSPIDAMRRRDIVRMLVMEDSPVLKVSTRENSSCGVLHALCPQCGQDLYAEPKGDFNVHCPECDYHGYRALSDGFGAGYSSSDDQPSSFNRAKQRWGKEMEQVFESGSASRSVLLRADHRHDGRKVEKFRFEDAGGARRGGDGRRGQREQARGIRLFVGGLSRDVNLDILKEAFAKHGEITDAVVMMDRETGNPRGFGFVTLAEQTQADAAVKALHSTNFSGRKITVKPADGGSGGGRGERGGRGGGRQQPGSKRIFAGGLPWAVDENRLKAIFSEHSEVLDVMLATDRETGRSRGFGFITVTEKTAAKVIEALDGSEIDGRKIGVREAEERGRGGGGRGGGDRGGRGGGGRGGGDRGGRGRRDSKPRSDRGSDERSSREQQARREEGIED